MPEHPPGRRPARRSPPGPDWRWILILGALLIVGGLMAFIKPFAASLTAVAIAGSILTLGGIVQLWIAFQDTGSRGARLVSAILGLLILAFGISLLANPLAGIVSLTLLIAGFFLAMGVLRIWLGLHLRARRGWGWMVASGVVSFGLGIAVVLAVPNAAGGLLGLFLGVDLVSSGIGATALALKLR